MAHKLVHKDWKNSKLYEYDILGIINVFVYINQIQILRENIQDIYA